MKNTKKKGFTIVELVIVIAVIGILSAILIPTFSGLVKDANDAALKQELRNAYVQYAADKAETGDLVAQEDAKVVKVKESNGSVYVYTNGEYDITNVTTGVVTVTPAAGENAGTVKVGDTTYTLLAAYGDYYVVKAIA